MLGAVRDAGLAVLLPALRRWPRCRRCRRLGLRSLQLRQRFRNAVVKLKVVRIVWADLEEGRLDRATAILGRQCDPVGVWRQVANHCERRPLIEIAYRQDSVIAWVIQCVVHSRPKIPARNRVDIVRFG